MTFLVARLAVPARPGVALLATFLSAFNPMFLSITGSVNNDNLVNALVPTGLALALSTWRCGFSWQRALAMAVVGTLAAASKVSGTLLFAPMGLAIALTIWRDRQPRTWIMGAALLFVMVWLGGLGWWYARNLNLYGDFFGNAHMARTVGLREAPISLPELLRGESGSFFFAYWGWLGGLTILGPLNLFSLAGVLWVGAA
ncbi:MAG: hypothetical protein HC915_03230, partial [Anaerolineae bacterium]|nr:hypothetical protein [Anaerolineae bacterium]